MISKRRSSLRRPKAPRSQTANRWVLSDRLNCPRLSHRRMKTGVVQQSQNTGRRNCYLDVGRRTSLCHSHRLWIFIKLLKFWRF